MPSALLLPLLICAVVLVVSGVAKLRDPASTDRGVASLRVPPPFDGPVVRRGLPWVEVALGLWLLVATGVAHLLVAFVVLVLFAAYLALVVRAVGGPDPAECGCFGALGDDRVTRVTVVRNSVLVLAAVLGLVAAFRDVSLLPTVRADPAAWAWLAAAVLTVATGVLVTWRSGTGAEGGARHAGGARVDDSGEYVREETPAVQVLTEDGELVLVASEARFAARLLVFLSPGCGPCQRIAPLVPGWAAELEPVSVHAVLLGPPAALTAHPALRGHAWFDPHRLAHTALAPGTPSAVLIGTDGLLAGGPVVGEEQVMAFVDEVRAHLARGTEPVADDEQDVATDDPARVSGGR